MRKWCQENLGKVVVATLSALCVGGVGFFYAFLHNRAKFDKDGRPIDSPQPPAPAVTPAPPARPPVGEAGLLALVADDLARAGKDAPHMRYLSLVHRHDDPTADAAQLDRDRQGLIDLVAALAPPNATATVAALDPARTAYRLDLRALDWTADTWRGATRDYPYGLNREDDEDRVTAEAAGKLRGLTDDRLPVVRADWWVSALTRPPLSAPGGPGLTTKSPPPAVKAAAEAYRDRAVDLAAAARELRATEDAVRRLIEAEPYLRDGFGLTPLLRPGGGVPRDAWESTANLTTPYQELAERLGRGKPVIVR